MELTKKINNTNNRVLVFSSAGDKANIEGWFCDDKNFDIFICYYGNHGNKYLHIADYYLKQKGLKFPNLKAVYDEFPEIFQKYDQVWVADDDVIISGKTLMRYFSLHQALGLQLSQPSFNSYGKVSHVVTAHRPLSLVRYTSYVEMTCPLFNLEQLDEFMAVYDPQLPGWGADLWFLDVLNSTENACHVGIIDDIQCINPRDFTKGWKREINQAVSLEQRIEKFYEIKKQHNIQMDLDQIKEYGGIAKPFKFRDSLDIAKCYLTLTMIRLIRWARDR